MLEIFGDDLEAAEKHMLPCPFCGKQPRLKPGKGDLISIICPEDSLCRGSKMFVGFLTDDIETAIKHWNYRWNGKLN